ncbi:ABC transporter permease [Nocardia farcinica]|nr:ABC transporter permease [Nocardia farcinica]
MTAMRSALTADLVRLTTLRTTPVYAALLVGACVGPIVLMTLLYDIEYRGPLDAGDLGKCASIFHVLAVVFAGATAAGEIRHGASAVAFLTQHRRWTSLLSHLLVVAGFLVASYVLGMVLALLATRCYPDGLAMTGRGWAYLGVYLLIILAWAVVATALAVLTRSVAGAIAGPLVWMLLLEQLMAMVPMLDPVLHWMPFTAGLDLAAIVLGEQSGPPVPAIVVLAAMVTVFGAAALAGHTRRDTAG